jgi:hypothetical protein
MQIPDPCEKITYDQTNVFGDKFEIGRRTAGHLDWTKQQLAKQIPGARIAIIQGTYHKGFPPSAGTHDFDRALDVMILDPDGEIFDYDRAQRFFRLQGWAAWHRTPQQSPKFSHHIHMVSLGGADCPVGDLIPAQIADYRNHAFGLEDKHEQGSDRSFFPPDIDATIFDYNAYLEDQMPYRDWPQADKEALVNDIVRGIMAFDVKNDPELVVTTREALVRAFNTPDILRALHQNP